MIAVEGRGKKPDWLQGEARQHCSLSGPSQPHEELGMALQSWHK